MATITSPTTDEYTELEALFAAADREYQSYMERCVSAAMLLESRYDSLDDYAKRHVDMVREARRKWVAASDAATDACHASLGDENALTEAGAR